MSQENVDLARREIAARSVRDWTALAEIWTLPESYIEAVLLDEAGEPTPKKRILFP